MVSIGEYNMISLGGHGDNLGLNLMGNKYNTGKFKKKVTLSHDEVTSEPTIARYTTVVTKTLRVCL
jgi:hypothetical protein